MRRILSKCLLMAMITGVTLLNSCAKKQISFSSAILSARSTAWHGQYADVATSEQPKEDFKVNNYIVVAYAPYEESKDSEIPYKFALTSDGKQVGLISLTELSGYGYLLCYKYFKGNTHLVKNFSKTLAYEGGNYVMYEIWRDMPEYKTLKYKTITAVTGTHGLSYTQAIGSDDSVAIVLSSDGTWKHTFSLDSNYVMTIVLPNVIKVEGDQKIQLSENGTWDFLHPDSLNQNNVYGTISLDRNVADIEVIPYDMAEKKPEPVFSPVPKYPELAKMAGVEGMVVVKSLIDIDGSIMRTEILESSRCSDLDLTALMCAMKARFTPAMQRNKMVKVWVSRPYMFKLR